MKKFLLELFYPDGVECVVCDQLLFNKDQYLCETCQSKLLYIKGKSCNACGKSLPDSFDGFYCSDCMGRDMLYSEGLACVAYDIFSAEVIWKFKYRHKRYIGPMIGREMSNLLKATYINDVNLIVPVPIWSGKHKQKGYNHSGIIAETIGALCDVKVIEDFLVRTRESRALKDLSKEERQEELTNIFELNELYKELSPRERKILLVDDIYTTGATVKECCKVLKAYGYDEIIVMVFATGLI
jgi:ComF family protein